MARKKSLSWRMFKGILGYSGKSSSRLMGSFRGKKGEEVKVKDGIKEDVKKENKKIEKGPLYDHVAVFDEPKVVNAVSGDYEDAEKSIYNDSLIMLIFGKRGSGKSALGFRLLENIYEKTERGCYALGLRQSLLPKWIESIDDVEEAKNGGVILVDEGAIAFGSRESMSKNNRELVKLMAIARHKDLTLMFITQNTGLIDKNVLKLVDVLLVKEGSLLQSEMERPEIKKFYEKSEKAFKGLDGNRKSFVYFVDSDFEGVISFSLPSFWGSGISKSRAG